MRAWRTSRVARLAWIPRASLDMSTTYWVDTYAAHPDRLAALLAGGE